MFWRQGGAPAGAYLGVDLHSKAGLELFCRNVPVKLGLRVGPLNYLGRYAVLSSGGAGSNIHAGGVASCLHPADRRIGRHVDAETPIIAKSQQRSGIQLRDEFLKSISRRR